MFRTLVLVAVMLSLSACQGTNRTALLQKEKAVEWDAITASDDGHNHGGFGTVI